MFIITSAIFISARNSNMDKELYYLMLIFQAGDWKSEVRGTSYKIEIRVRHIEWLIDSFSTAFSAQQLVMSSEFDR